MVSLSHALQILITAKDLTGSEIKKPGDKIASLIGIVTKFSKVLTLLKVGASIAFAPLLIGAGLAAGLAAVLGTVTVGVVGLVGALATLPHALAKTLMKLTEYASELDLARRAMAGVAGEGAPAMLKALKESSAFMVEEVELLQTYNKAYTLLGKNLADKLPALMGHLTKVAAATGDDVTRLAELTIRSVGRMSTRWMAYVGVMVTVEEAELRAAEMFGVLTEELTYQQKQAGLLDLTLQRLEARTSAMPDVMGTAAQMAQSLTVAYKELYGDLTAFLLPVVRALYPLVMKIVTGFRALIAEGGALYRPIRTVTAAIVVLTEELSYLWDKIFKLASEGTSAIESFANNIFSLAWKAFSWGAHMITNFAAGIIKGASIALISAMNFVGGLLSFWLGPGSPPRVASNIDLWGSAAFTEFLKGFMMADFDVLEGVQAPLRRALSILVDLERLAPLAAFELFVGLSEDLAVAIEEFNRTGNVSAIMLERLSQVGGAFGDDLAELFRRYTGLSAATRAYAEAQERLKRAIEAEDSATKRLSKEAREYNKLVRAGADPAILRGKLAGVKASYASLVAARKEAEEAEEAEERAKEQLRLQKEQVRLQERLLNQLIAMAEAQAAALKAAGGEEGGVIPPIEWPEVYPIPLDQAFEDLKESIRKKFQELWDELTGIWEDSEAGLWVEELKKRWDTFREDTLGPLGEELGKVHEGLQDIGEVEYGLFSGAWEKWVGFWDRQAPKILGWWDKWVAWWDKQAPKILAWWEDLKTWWENFSWEDLVEDLKTTVVTKLTEIGQAVIDKWEEIKTDADEKWEEIKQAVGTKIEELFEWMGLDMDEMLLRWEKIWEDVKLIALTVWERFKEGVVEKAEEIYSGILLWIDKVKVWLSGQWETIKVTARLIWGGIVTWITTKVTAIHDKVKFWIRILRAWWDYQWGEIKTKAIDLFGETYEAIKKKVQKIYAAVTGKIDEIKVWISSKWNDFWNLGYDMVRGIGDGIGAMAGWLLRKATRLVENVIAAIKRTLQIPGSASGVGEDLGEALIQGLADGMDKVATLPAIAMEKIVGELSGGLEGSKLRGNFAARPGGRSAGVTIHNHFNRDSIRSAADVYQLSKQITRSLTLRGARTVV